MNRLRCQVIRIDNLLRAIEGGSPEALKELRDMSNFAAYEGLYVKITVEQLFYLLQEE